MGKDTAHYYQKTDWNDRLLIERVSLMAKQKLKPELQSFWWQIYLKT